MAQGIQFTSYVPTSLVGNNSPSPTLAAEAVTGLPISTGAFPGNCFYLSEVQANQLSQSAINSAPPLICHAGWYMVVQVSSAATAANIVQGAIGAQLSIPTTQAAALANIPPAAVVTDGATAATAGFLGINPVVFLNAVTAGYYTIVQIAGDASVAMAATQTTVIGSAVLSATPGLCSAGGSTAITAANIYEIVGLAETVQVTPGGALTLTSVAASSGGTAVYTGTITNGTSNAFKGLYFVITGFAGANNNSAGQSTAGFYCSASSTTTLTLANPIATAETHAGTATSTNLVRVQLAFPFGII